MRRYFCHLIFALVIPISMSFATPPSGCVPLLPRPSYDDGANISGMSLVGSRIEITRRGKWENRTLIVTLEASLKGGPGAQVESMEVSSAQANLEYGLNPSDFYIHAKVKPPEGITLLSLVQLPPVKYEMDIHIDHRSLPATPEDWPLPDPQTRLDHMYYLNFDGGMTGGYNRWHTYRLSFADLNNVHLKYLKTFTLVQGQMIVHHEAP